MQKWVDDKKRKGKGRKILSHKLILFKYSTAWKRKGHAKVREEQKKGTKEKKYYNQS